MQRNAVRSTLLKFLLFFTLSAFYLPAIVAPFAWTAYQEEDFDLGLAEYFIEMGNLYLTYVTVMLFAGNGLLLLQPGRWIRSKLKEKEAATSEEKAFAWANRPFDFMQAYATNLTMFLMSLSFLVINPLISLMGSMYFNIRYLIDKYNFCCINYVEIESKGTLWRIVARLVILAVLTF